MESKLEIDSLNAFMFGIFVALLATALAFLVTSPPYFKMDLSKVPSVAAEIAKEGAGKVETPAEWDSRMRRFSKALVDGGYKDDVKSRTVVASWYWFILLPLIAIAALYLKTGVKPRKVAAGLLAPSYSILLIAFILLD